MRDGHAVTIGIARGYGAIRRVLEERGREELEARLVLREIDDASLPRAAAALERGEDGDDAVADRDVVDVRPIQDDRRPVGIAEQLREAGERGELAPVAGMLRVRSGLSLIAAR